MTLSDRKSTVRRERRHSGLGVDAFTLALVTFLLAPQMVLLANSPLLPIRGHIDLGAVRPGERIRQQFVVANLSLRPMKVLSVSGGCGCVASIAGANSLAPFTIKTIQTAFGVRETQGLVHREVILEIDDPRHPYLALD